MPETQVPEAMRSRPTANCPKCGKPATYMAQTDLQEFAIGPAVGGVYKKTTPDVPKFVCQNGCSAEEDSTFCYGFVVLPTGETAGIEPPIPD